MKLISLHYANIIRDDPLEVIIIDTYHFGAVILLLSRRDLVSNNRCFIQLVKSCLIKYDTKKESGRGMMHLFNF